MVSSHLSGLACLECLDLHQGLGLALPHLVPHHEVHLLPGPSEGDAQILVPAQCEAQKGRPSKLPSAVQKGWLKVVEDDEQAYLARFLENFLRK